MTSVGRGVHATTVPTPATRAGVTVISATHDHKMLAVSDRIAWIRDGRLDRIDGRMDRLEEHQRQDFRFLLRLILSGYAGGIAAFGAVFWLLAKIKGWV